jgi:hypothetical protein
MNVLVKGQPHLLRPSVQDELYSLGREALTNALRHAQATEITLEINYEAKQFLLVCHDNGRGLEAEVARAEFKSGHWGIPGKRERARSLGAKFELVSSPESETRIQAWVAAQKAYLDYESEPGRSIRFLRRLMPLWRPAQRVAEERREEPTEVVRASGTGIAVAEQRSEHEPQTSKAFIQ